MSSFTGSFATPSIWARHTRRQPSLFARLTLAVLGVLTFLSLAGGNAWATAPKLVNTFAAPAGDAVGQIAVNEETGEIFVVDNANDSVDRYNSSGTLIEEIEGSSTTAGSFNFNFDSLLETKLDEVAIDNSGGSGQGDLYIESRNGEAVWRFDLEGGAYKQAWETLPNLGARPTGLGVDGLGNPWVTARAANLVAKLSPVDGSVLKVIETPGWVSESVAFDSAHLFVTDIEAGFIELDVNTGAVLETVPGFGSFDIAVDPSTDYRYIAHGNEVSILTPANEPVSGTPLSDISDVVAVNSAAGMMYTINRAEAKIKAWKLAAIVPLTIAKDGFGSGTVSSSPGAIDCGATCSAEFEEGETILLTAVPDPGSSVAGWTGCEFLPGPTECEVTIGPSNEVTVDFAASFELTVAKTGPGTVTSSPAGISCGSTCSHSYTEGTVVALTATPLPHNKVTWSGCDAEPTANKCEVTMDDVKNVAADFVPIMHTLSIAMAGSGSGSVACNGGPCASSYPEGTKVTLTGTPASSSTFAGFSGAGCSGTTCDVTIEADTAVSATFNAKPTEPPKTCANTPSLCPPPPPPNNAYGKCVAKATKAYKKAKKAAAHKHGKAKGQAMKAANRAKHKAIARCKAQFK